VNPIEQLERLARFLRSEAEADPAFARRLEAALKGEAPSSTKSSGKRAAPAIDPFQLFDERGEEALRSELAQLAVEQLKDIVAHHGMDTAKLAMKWKTPDRLVSLILDRVRQRSSKGDAFRS